MTIRDDKFGQSLLLPLNVGELIHKDHICRLVIAVVDTLDMTQAEERYVGTPGNPAYSRRMLLRVFIQASLDGIFSSRNIDRLCHENVVYMYLTGHEHPDFRTLCDFRKDNSDLVEYAFSSTVVIAKALGIVKFQHISTDGTKMKANASTRHNLTQEEISWIRDLIQKGIETDEEEDRLYGDRSGDELPGDIDQEKIREKIEEYRLSSGKKPRKTAVDIANDIISAPEEQKEKLEEELDRAEEQLQQSGQKAVSITDPESRFMKNKKQRIELCYNTQITVDHGSGIILANDVVQDCTDHGQLKPQIEQVEMRVGDLPPGTEVSADNGYYSGENLRFLEERGLDGYIPDSWQAQEEKGKRGPGAFSKSSFSYDENKDEFTCPHGEELTRRGEYVRDGKAFYAYWGAPCGTCPDQSECAGKGKHRVITSDGYEAERRRMRAKMDTPEGEEIYGRRKEWAEWPFGNLKHNLGFTEFYLRGNEKVKIEQNILSAAHNLKVIWRNLEGDLERIEEIGGMRPEFRPDRSETIQKNRVLRLRQAKRSFLRLKLKTSVTTVRSLLAGSLSGSFDLFHARISC